MMKKDSIQRDECLDIIQRLNELKTQIRKENLGYTWGSDLERSILLLEGKFKEEEELSKAQKICDIEIDMICQEFDETEAKARKVFEPHQYKYLTILDKARKKKNDRIDVAIQKLEKTGFELRNNV